MENVRAEVNGKIRSAIKAKLMELGAYVDEELPDYIMVMVVNKRTKEQMEDDLQLFLGNNTEHFTIWLHQVLQKLEEVTGLDKKVLKPTVSSEPETSERKRKTSAGSVESDSHRKEKRRKSHETKKAKKTGCEPDKGKEQKKDADSSISMEVEQSLLSPTEDPVKDSLVSSSVSDINVENSGINKTDDEGTVNSGVVSSSSVVESEQVLVSIDTEDSEIVAASKEITTNSEGGESQIPSNAKIVLMHSEDDDDEDFINIKADAEAEALLNEELPKEPTAVSSKPLTPVIEHIPLSEENQVPAKTIRKVDIVVETCSEPEKTETPVAISDRKRPLGKDISGSKSPVTALSERFTRKRKLEKEPQVGATPSIRLVTQALSIKDRLGIKKPVTVENSEQPRPAPRVQDRLGVRTVAVEPLKKKKIEPIVISPNMRNSTQALEKTLRNRISRRAPEGESFTNNTNQDQRRRPILSRVVLPQPGREEEEYDPANPAVGSVASVVRVKPRPRLPAEMQANKNLLLKAVAEAQKSVAAVPIRPEPISASRRNINVLQESLLARRARAANIAITLPNCRANSQKMDADSERLVLPASHSRDKITIHVSTDSMKSNNIVKGSLRNPTNIRYKNEELTLDAEQQLNHSIEVSVENDDDMLPDEGIVTEETEIEEEVPLVYPPVGLASRITRERPQPPRSESPQFLVTLDGLDPNMFTSRSNSMDNDQSSPTNEEEEEDEEQDDDSSKVSSSPSPVLKEKVNKSVSPIVFTKKDSSTAAEVPKSLERCKYWPSCRLGDKCAFHHPSTSCKSFPKCPFKDKCLYIHPMCKFDSSCTRRDCPFAHIGFNALITPLVTGSANRLKLKSGGSSQVCKYFPKCINSLCQYLHPKPCRYGKFCSKPTCNYLHDELPSVDKLKWTSPYRT